MLVFGFSTCAELCEAMCKGLRKGAGCMHDGTSAHDGRLSPNPNPKPSRQNLKTRVMEQTALVVHFSRTQWFAQELTQPCVLMLVLTHTVSFAYRVLPSHAITRGVLFSHHASLASIASIRTSLYNMFLSLDVRTRSCLHNIDPCNLQSALVSLD